MFRVATWYESRLGRNDGNPLYVTAALKRLQYYGDILAGRPVNDGLLTWFTSKELDPAAEAVARQLFEKHGETIECDHFYPTGDVAPFGTYDLNIWTDWGEDGLTHVLPYSPIGCPHPMAYWASDTHIQTPTADSYPYRMNMAKAADYAFVAQKRGLEQMEGDGVANPIWLPHAVEPLAYPKIERAAKRYDICFVGHINTTNREDALDRLFREFPNFYYGQQLFENAAQKFCESKIVFNIAMTDDINMRNFEAMGTGSFLLTNWIPTIEEFFQDGKHLALYHSEEEMIDKAKYYLSHDAEREKIAQAGYEEVMAKHTILHRVMKMLDVAMADRQKLVTA